MNVESINTAILAALSTGANSTEWKARLVTIIDKCREMKSDKTGILRALIQGLPEYINIYKTDLQYNVAVILANALFTLDGPKALLADCIIRALLYSSIEPHMIRSLTEYLVQGLEDADTPLSSLPRYIGLCVERHIPVHESVLLRAAAFNPATVARYLRSLMQTDVLGCVLLCEKLMGNDKLYNVIPSLLLQPEILSSPRALVELDTLATHATDEPQEATCIYRSLGTGECVGPQLLEKSKVDADVYKIVVQVLVVLRLVSQRLVANEDMALCVRIARKDIEGAGISGDDLQDVLDCVESNGLFQISEEGDGFVFRKPHCVLQGQGDSKWVIQELARGTKSKE